MLFHRLGCMVMILRNTVTERADNILLKMRLNEIQDIAGLRQLWSAKTYLKYFLATIIW